MLDVGISWLQIERKLRINKNFQHLTAYLNYYNDKTKINIL